MKSGFVFSLILFLSGFGLVSGEDLIRLDPIYGNLTVERPVALIIPEDGTKRRFLVEQTGKIRILPSDEDAAEAKTFLDVNDRMRVDRAFEEGLLGLAFHPKYRENGRFYIYYSKQGPKRTVLSEFTVSADDPDKADPGSERILLEIQQPDWNHNSGNLFFHPEDGYLYVAVGDGGRRHNVFMLAQNMTRWNGKILRIDVDSRSEGREYGIPADNPFVDDPNACPEIYALGLRNPWGGDIDEETGLFYLADVGQNAYEEINLIVKGGNYGWSHREGKHDFEQRAKLMEAINEGNKIPKGVTFIDPIHEYNRTPASITGGFVYRGEAIPALKGHFIYGDWRFGQLWALHYDPATKKVDDKVLLTPPIDAKPQVQPTGFYPDEYGEPIVLGWNGKLFRMTAK